MTLGIKGTKCDSEADRMPLDINLYAFANSNFFSQFLFLMKTFQFKIHFTNKKKLKERLLKVIWLRHDFNGVLFLY